MLQKQSPISQWQLVIVILPTKIDSDLVDGSSVNNHHYYYMF